MDSTGGRSKAERASSFATYVLRDDGSTHSSTRQNQVVRPSRACRQLRVSFLNLVGVQSPAKSLPPSKPLVRSGGPNVGRVSRTVRTTVRVLCARWSASVYAYGTARLHTHRRNKHFPIPCPGRHAPTRLTRSRHFVAMLICRACSPGLSISLILVQRPVARSVSRARVPSAVGWGCSDMACAVELTTARPSRRPPAIKSTLDHGQHQRPRLAWRRRPAHTPPAGSCSCYPTSSRQPCRPRPL